MEREYGQGHGMCDYVRVIEDTWARPTMRVDM
jgi:hypothetical protein